MNTSKPQEEKARIDSSQGGSQGGGQNGQAAAQVSSQAGGQAGSKGGSQDSSQGSIQENFILNGNLWKVMAKLSWPAVIAMVLYGANTVLDAYFVGHFVGEDAFAGVSLAYPLATLTVALGSMVGTGAGSLLSIAIGAKDFNTQQKLIGSANGLSLICTIIFMVLALIFAEPLVRLMGGQGDMLVLGVEYFRVCTYGALFWVMGLALNMIIRAEGKMVTAAWMMGAGLVINAIANYIFIVLMNMGVEGAAWGTNVGMLAYTLFGLMYFKLNKASFKTVAFSLKMDKHVTKEIIRLGIPALLMSAMALVQAAVVFNALSEFGTAADIALYGIVNRLFNFLMTPIMGLMRASQPVIGINFGAKQYDRTIQAYKVFSYAALILTVPFWLITFIYPEIILSSMYAESAVSSSQLMAIRIYMSILPLLSFVLLGMTFFPAIGNSKPAGILGMARQFVFYVPVMLLVPRFFGVDSVYYASFAIDLIVTIWCMIWIKFEFKRIRQLH